jgi:hypothetical protein
VSAPDRHPEERSSARHNRKVVAVDLRRGRASARELPSQADLRDAMQVAREQQRDAGIALLSSRG